MNYTQWVLVSPLSPFQLWKVDCRSNRKGTEAPAPPTFPPEPKWPPAADLRRMMEDNPLPVIAPNIFASDPISDEIAMVKARDVLERLNGAMLVTKDANDLEQCFFSEQAYWRDQIALTWHLRTFSNRRVIATSLLEMSSLRGVADDSFKIDGHAHFIPALVGLTERLYAGNNFKRYMNFAD